MHEAKVSELIEERDNTTITFGDFNSSILMGDRIIRRAMEGYKT